MGNRVAVVAPAIDMIRYWHRQRCFLMDQRKRCDLALGAFLRIQLGWSRTLPEPERKAIAAKAQALIDDPAGSEWTDLIAASKQMSAPFETIEKRAIKAMTEIGETLPVWEPFGKNIRGFGPGSLAVIVGEAGDLSNYATVAKLWKRMGVGVLDGVRQGGLAKGAAKEEWIAHGYNRERRSRLWNVGDALIKGNQTGEYRTAYLDRKAYEIARDPEIKPIKAHRRAQRYMEKKLLKNLWNAWRRAVPIMATTAALPASTPPLDHLHDATRAPIVERQP